MLDDGILRELKKRAAAEGRSVRAVANHLLRQALGGRGKARERFVMSRKRRQPQRGSDEDVCEGPAACSRPTVDTAKDWEMLMSACATMRP